MTKVYTSQDRVLVGHVRNVLDSHGIRTKLRNDFLAGASGEIPFVETWPEIWLIDDNDVVRARALIAELLAEADKPGPAWTCKECGETVGGQFGECWNCGARHPGD